MEIAHLDIPTGHARDSRAVDEVPLLVATGLSKRWGKLTVLEDVALELRSGAVTVVTGRNGAGKTTLLRILAGLIAPDRGDVRVDGLHPIKNRRAYQTRVSFLTAGQGGLYARLTVAQHLRYAAGLALLPSAEGRAAAARVTADFDLAELAGRRVDRLSTGQRQRVRLAMAFVLNPEIVLLDEPQMSLDDEALEALTSLVNHFTQTGGAVAWCSPAHRVAGLVADSVYVLEDGKLVA
jgi:ABC-type multidrug transport system ATPase subunit